MPRHDTERDLSFTDTISHNGRRIAAAAMLAALALIALLALRPAAASASTSEWSFFEDHSYLVRSAPAVRQNTLDEIKSLGADTLRSRGEVERGRSAAGLANQAELRCHRPRAPIRASGRTTT